MDAKVITVMNMKGGVGKTTLTAQIGAILGKDDSFPRVKKTLVIDYDPQFNLSQAFLDATRYYSTIDQHKHVESILTDRVQDASSFDLPTAEKSTPPKVSELTTNILENEEKGKILDIVVSDIKLMHIALGTGEQKMVKMATRFKLFINEAKKIYDLIIIDCHPAGSLFTKTALENSTDILIPVTQHNYSFRGLNVMDEFINKITIHKPQKHIIFNEVAGDTTAIEARVREENNFKDCCLTAKLKDNIHFRKLDNGTGYLWEIDDSGLAYVNISDITNELLTRVYK